MRTTNAERITDVMFGKIVVILAIIALIGWVLYKIVEGILASRRAAMRKRVRLAMDTQYDDKPVLDDKIDEKEEPVDEPIVVNPIIDRMVVDEPVVDEPIVDEPVVDEPVVNEPVVDEPIVDEPIVDEPAETAESTESTESAESTESTETVESAESAEDENVFEPGDSKEDTNAVGKAILLEDLGGQSRKRAREEEEESENN